MIIQADRWERRRCVLICCSSAAALHLVGSVDDDKRVSRLKETIPEARRVVWWPENNYLSMIDGIITATESTEDVFRDVVIDTDGEIAAANFDYSLLIDGKAAHWGREMWHLAHTDDGWKIISVIWLQKDPVSDQ